MRLSPRSRYIQITGWTAVGSLALPCPSDGNDALVVHTGRDIYGYLYCSFLLFRFLCNHRTRRHQLILPVPPHWSHGGYALELPERRPLRLTRSGRILRISDKSSWKFPVLSPLPLQVGTCNIFADLNFFLRTKSSFFKGDGYGLLQVSAFSRAGLLSAAGLH